MTSTRPQSWLRVRGARTHNLQGVSCDLPHGQLTVVTGPSGAGKSSLVFDTIFAEGQRRFVDSLSTYAQQFVSQLERPPVDEVQGVLPAIALEARNPIRSARATVGSLTETLGLLRWLFASLADPACPLGHGPVPRRHLDDLVAELTGGAVGDPLVLTVPMPRPATDPETQLRELVGQGYFRAWHDGAPFQITADMEWRTDWDPLEILLGRFRAGAGRERLTEVLEEGLRLAPARLWANRPDGSRRVLSCGRVCAECGTEVAALTVAHLSFDSPLGACGTCSGFGRVIGVDRALVVPDRSRALAQRPFAPWNTPAYEEMYPALWAACRRRGVPLDVPWDELSPATRAWIWAGGRGFVGLTPFFEDLERRSYRVHVRVLLARYRDYRRCPDCQGARLQPEARAILWRDQTLPGLTAQSIEGLLGWMEAQTLTPAEEARVREGWRRLRRRLSTLARVGLDYLTLDRSARTLSGGESQRIHLATALGSGLTGTLYALDEPTVGLHASDSRRLVGLLRELAASGNTVVVVEHEPVVIREADYLIELGPAAGENGGRVIWQGPAAELEQADTLTSRYLQRPAPQLARRHLARRRQERGLRPLGSLERKRRIVIRRASENNLRDIDVELPLGCLVAVTGVSGSGKSTLVESVLYDGARAAREGGVRPGRCEALEGLDAVTEVDLVDQNPLGRSARSIPVTVVRAFGELRRLFASSESARRQGLSPGHFSFNSDKGRCPHCRGTGWTEVDLQFMGDVTIPCEACGGRRYRPEILEVRYRGHNIAEALDLTVSEAGRELGDHLPLSRRLAVLEAVGLGYLRLGQPTSTLSAGEAQRLKLATFLRRPGRARERRLFLFDEPTTGLHLSDIAQLYRALRRLVQRGHGVVVVEHQLDLIARADWVVDLGPGGGRHGGDLMHCGPLNELLDDVDSPTAVELRTHLGWRRRRRYSA